MYNSDFITFSETKQQIVVPSNLDELKHIIKKNKYIRAYTSKYSWSKGILGTVMVKMEKINAIESFDENNQTITVQSGVKLKDLTDYLRKKGYCLNTYPSTDIITIGGAVCNGVYGSGNATMGILNDSITNIYIIDANGEECIIKDGDNDMKAARLSLGLMGIVFKITLKVERDIKLNECVQVINIEDENISKEYSKHYSLQYLMIGSTNYAFKVTLNKVKENAPLTSLKMFYQDLYTIFGLGCITSKVLILLMRKVFFRGPIYRTLKKSYIFHRSTDEGPILKTANYFNLTKKYNISGCIEYQIPFQYTEDMIQDFLRFRKANIAKGREFDGLQRIRFSTIKSDIYLQNSIHSMNKPLTSISLMIWTKNEYWYQLCSEYESLMLSYKGIPHFGKITCINPFLNIEKLFLNKFKKIISKYDPNKKFMNDFWKGGLLC